MASDPAILGTEPTKAELATAKAVGAHGTASLDTALRSRLHRRCSNSGTPLAVALAAKTAVGRAGPAKAELAAAKTVGTQGAVSLDTTLWHRLGLSLCSHRKVGEGKGRKRQSLRG